VAFAGGGARIVAGVADGIEVLASPAAAAREELGGMAGAVVVLWVIGAAMVLWVGVAVVL